MAIFRSAEHLYAILELVFAGVRAHPAEIEPFTGSNLVIRLRTVEPTAEVLLDGRQPPLQVFYGERPGKANLEVLLPADLLHAIWVGAESASSAFFSGRIQTKGNFLKATPLFDLFRVCEQVYTKVAQEEGLGDV
jgi:hypothetical protein